MKNFKNERIFILRFVKKILILFFKFSLILLSIPLSILTVFFYLWIVQKKIKILTNHREEGFGHNINELFFAAYSLKKNDISKGLIFYRTVPVTKFFSNLFKDKILFCNFILTYLFYFFVLVLESHKKNTIEIGTNKKFDLLLDKVKKDNKYLINRKQVFKKRIEECKVVTKSKVYKKIVNNIEFFDKKNTIKYSNFLSELNIKKDDWFICIHAREVNDNDKFRSGSFHDYKKLVEYISQEGGYIIRLGDKLKSFQNKNLINLCETDYNKVGFNMFVIQNSSLFVSTSSGPQSTHWFLETPQVQVNCIPESAPYNSIHSYMPILIIDKETNNFVPASKYWEYYFNHSNLITERYTVLKNSPDDILNACKYKFLEVKNNNYSSNESQDVWKGKFPSYSYYRYIESKVDPIFYKKYFNNFFNK